MKRALCMALAALTLTAAARVEIGGAVGELPSPKWLDGGTRNLATLTAGKKFAVIYLWTIGQTSLSDFPRIASVAERYGSDVAFVGVGIGAEERLRKFPGSERLGFPVNADPEGAALNEFGVTARMLPAALVLDGQRRLLWRGRSAGLPGTLDRCLAGKFDLKEEIRRDQFAAAVGEAIRAQDFERALKLLREEWEKDPASLELLNAQVALLTRKLKKTDEAFDLIHAAQKKNPGKHRFFEAEYKLLAPPEQEKRLPEFFARVRKEFADQPAVLMAFAAAEMGRPADDLNLKTVLALADAGWRSKGFQNDTERGMFAIEYAKILHAVGRTDLAEKLAQKAFRCFKGDEKRREGAKSAALYYSKMLVIAPEIKVPDL